MPGSSKNSTASHQQREVRVEQSKEWDSEQRSASAADVKKPLRFHLGFLSLLIVFIVSVDATALAVVVPVSVIVSEGKSLAKAQTFAATAAPTDAERRP